MEQHTEISDVAIWGLGRVGTGFALALSSLPISLHLYSSTELSRARATKLGLTVESSIDDWNAKAQSAQIVALGWSDDALNDALSTLALPLNSEQTVIHFSGLLNGANLGRSSAHLGSLHPLAACPNPKAARDVFKHGPLVLEGSEPARKVMERLTNQLGAKSFQLQEGQKSKYHAGAVLASNTLVGLLHLARHQWEQAGLEQADELLVSLSRSALNAVASQGLKDGLTGPLKRGDLGSLESHLAVLDDEATIIYKGLHRQLVKLLGRESFEENVQEALDKLLKS